MEVEDNMQLLAYSDMMVYLCFMNKNTIVGIITVFTLGTLHQM